LVTRAIAPGGGGGALLYAGLSDNTVQAWRLEAPADGAVGWRAARILTAECTERCLLYSMRLALDPPAPPGAGGRGYDGGASRATAATERLFAAAGTIFNEVLVWRLPALPRSPSAAEPSAASLAALAARWAAIEARLTAACGGGPPALAAAAPAPSVSRVVTVAPLYRLCGHEGSIHRVSWIPGAWQLASCSDDRTARLWSLSGAAHGCAHAAAVAAAVAAALASPRAP
jgi:WD40 repeat protein